MTTKTRKGCYLSDRDLHKMCKLMSDNSFKHHIIVSIGDEKVMFFHNDRLASPDGLNKNKINLFKKLNRLGKVDKFICCYPEETGINVDLCFLPLAIGQVTAKGGYIPGKIWVYANKRND